jgi:hypothetical protein
MVLGQAHVGPNRPAVAMQKRQEGLSGIFLKDLWYSVLQMAKSASDLQATLTTQVTRLAFLVEL